MTEGPSPLAGDEPVSGRDLLVALFRTLQEQELLDLEQGDVEIHAESFPARLCWVASGLPIAVIASDTGDPGDRYLLLYMDESRTRLRANGPGDWRVVRVAF